MMRRDEPLHDSSMPALHRRPLFDRRRFLFAGGAAAVGGSAGPTFGQGQAPMNHIVLLGDSIFDNAAYVAGGPDVVRQLRDIMPSGWRATLNALDGAVIADVPQQLQNLPRDASHLVVSAGGNDALGQANLLDRDVRSTAEALELITDVRERFRLAYARMLDQVLERGHPLAACTIYEPRFPEPLRRSRPLPHSRRSTMRSRGRLLSATSTASISGSFAMTIATSPTRSSPQCRAAQRSHGLFSALPHREQHVHLV